MLDIPSNHQGVTIVKLDCLPSQANWPTCLVCLSWAFHRRSSANRRTSDGIIAPSCHQAPSKSRFRIITSLLMALLLSQTAVHLHAQIKGEKDI